MTHVFKSNTFYMVIGGFLWSLVPIISIATNNVEYLIWSNVFETSAIISGGTIVIIALLSSLSSSGIRIAAALVLVNAYSGHHAEIMRILTESGVGQPKLHAAAGVLFFLAAALLALGALDPRFIARVTAAVGAALFVSAAVPLMLAIDVNDVLRSGRNRPGISDHSPIPEPATVPARLPDIIYIVPDRYGGASVLEDALAYRNDAFLDSLRARGFQVANWSRANYLKTHHSLASSLNMQYLDDLLAQLDGKTRHSEPLYSLIRDNLVVRRLKRLGYRYVHVGSWWDGTASSELADVQIDFSLPRFGGEFGQEAVEGNVLLSLVAHLLDPASSCSALKQQLRFLEDVAGDDRPTFVFAHVLAPHSPIATDEEGNCIEKVDYPKAPPHVTWEQFTRAYVGYVKYLNRRFLEIFDQQRTENPNPLIFVLQADEGPFPKAYRESIAGFDPARPGSPVAPFDWRMARDDELAMKFGILNALYLGDPADFEFEPSVPETLTPVNNWRLIFSRIEGRRYPLLRDRFYIFPTEAQPYRSIEITDRLDAMLQARRR